MLGRAASVSSSSPIAIPAAAWSPCLRRRRTNVGCTPKEKRRPAHARGGMCARRRTSIRTAPASCRCCSPDSTQGLTDGFAYATNCRPIDACRAGSSYSAGDFGDSRVDGGSSDSSEAAVAAGIDHCLSHYTSCLLLEITPRLCPDGAGRMFVWARCRPIQTVNPCPPHQYGRREAGSCRCCGRDRTKDEGHSFDHGRDCRGALP
jgi:hypothetical protein